jgi:Holliday junction resolvase RusA-like endonuclease
MRISQAEYDTLVRLGLLPSHDLKVGSRLVDSDGTVHIVLPGAPIGKPRMTRRDKWKGRPCVTRYHEWCDRLRAVAGTVPPADRTASVSWTAVFEPPGSMKKAARCALLGTLHRTKPDRDNIDKAILDALWPDGDSGIASGTVTKLWGMHPRIEIDIAVTTAPGDNE